MDENINTSAMAGAIRSAPLNPALSPFPNMHGEQMERVSIDAQFYLRCEACGFEERCRHEPPDDDLEQAAEQEMEPACLGCGKRAGRAVVRHLVRDQGHCLDCTTAFDTLSGPWLVPYCAACGSRRLDVQETNIHPPFPARFGERDNITWIMAQVSTDKTHIWGIDGVDDAMRLKAESDMWGNMPNAHAASYGLMLFAERLRLHCAYEDLMSSYLIANIEANLAQNYYRSTGWLPCIELAMQLFEKMIDLAPDPLNQGLAHHSFAMAAFSLFTKLGFAGNTEAIGWPGLHETAINSAQVAESIFQELVSDGVAGADLQVARIRWLLGDLVRVGSQNDEQRRRAVAYFDQALRNEKLAHRCGFALRASRGGTLAMLDEPQPDDHARAVEDLRAAMVAGGSDQAYSDRWRAGYTLSRLLLKYGSWEEALPLFQRTASLVWQQFQANSDEQQVLSQSEQFVHVFEGLATLYASLGWSDEALALVEITRCSTVRLYTMDAVEHQRSAQMQKAKWLESLHPASLKDAGLPGFGGTPSAMHIDDILEELAIGVEVLPILNAHPRIATGLLALLVDEGIVTALLCNLTITSDGSDKPHWTARSVQWRLTLKQIEGLGSTRHLSSGPFRERLIGKLCQRGAEALLVPILEPLRASGVSRLLVSLPGWMAGLPLEAFSDSHQQPLLPGLGVSVGYLPSVRLGSDLLDRQRDVGSAFVHGQTTPRQCSVLFIGYGDTDLDTDRAEYEGIYAACGGNLTYLPGSLATKARVLEALHGEYDIIHIQAHGTFDEANPLNSALHFISDLDDDSRRVTAFDLLHAGRFARTPLIVLSACSSAMTTGWRTGAYHGLLGSLLRIGAMGLIGSRWPVSDKGAVRFMTRLYEMLLKRETLPEQALHSVGQELCAEGAPRELWAAFGYFGMS